MAVPRDGVDSLERLDREARARKAGEQACPDIFLSEIGIKVMDADDHDDADVDTADAGPNRTCSTYALDDANSNASQEALDAFGSW